MINLPPLQNQHQKLQKLKNGIITFSFLALKKHTPSKTRGLILKIHNYLPHTHLFFIAF
jgi:hypothetical protein